MQKGIDLINKGMKLIWKKYKWRMSENKIKQKMKKNANVVEGKNKHTNQRGQLQRTKIGRQIVWEVGDRQELREVGEFNF